MRKYFNIIGKKLLLVREYTWRLWVWRIKIFLEKINGNACTLENSLHIFSSVSGKLPPGKFPPIKLSPGECPLENSHLEYSHQFLKYFRPSFLFFFFSLLLPLSLILLKRLFCNSVSKVLKFLRL